MDDEFLIIAMVVMIRLNGGTFNSRLFLYCIVRMLHELIIVNYEQQNRIYNTKETNISQFQYDWVLQSRF